MSIEQQARDLIAAERRRQVEIERWHEAHDDEHDDGSLLQAGVLYMNWGTEHAPSLQPDGTPIEWPWDPQWWKPKDRQRNLERAGALMLAEKERLGRVRWRDIEIKRVGRQIHPASIYTNRLGKPTAHVDQKLEICISELAAVLELKP